MWTVASYIQELNIPRRQLHATRRPYSIYYSMAPTRRWGEGGYWHLRGSCTPPLIFLFFSFFLLATPGCTPQSAGAHTSRCPPRAGSCYASPAVRLLRCVAGHLDPSEEAFPYALATLDALTVSLLRG